MVLEAEGRREAAFRDAEARERAAEAEAKATLMVSEAIAGGNIQAINYFVANNYVKALEALATAPNQKVLMLPLEATSLMGSLDRHCRDRARGLRRRTLRPGCTAAQAQAGQQARREQRSSGAAQAVT